ncbi:MAG TPA: 2-dehydropantoate 2-reductase, partial [Candidatus Paceibacterota bacterium]
MAKTITNKTIGIFGPGAIGGFLAGALWKAGCDVAVIARPDTALRLNAGGICLKTKLLGDFIARPTVVERMASAPALLIVAVKANDLASALPHIHSAVGEQTLIIPFQNGIEHIALLKKEFGERVIVGMIGNIVAEKEKGGCIVSPSASVTIELGSEDVPQEKLREVAG